MTKPWLSADWPAPAQVHAGVTLRQGGFSPDNYASLNPALHVGDDAQLVQQNRTKISSMLNLPSEPVWLTQMHGSTVITADIDRNRAADASITSVPDIVCCVLTADCLPLLLCTADGQSVAAVHAGWKGLLAGIIDNTINRLPKKPLLAWMGPAIGPECFEVGVEVRNAYVQKSQDYRSAFKPLQQQDKWLADIYQLTRITLFRLGVENIYGGGFCTICDADTFYSYRRDGTTGRMASLIWRSNSPGDQS